jgi:hypothetical protein
MMCSIPCFQNQKVNLKAVKELSIGSMSNHMRTETSILLLAVQLGPCKGHSHAYVLYVHTSPSAWLKKGICQMSILSKKDLQPPITCFQTALTI